MRGKDLRVLEVSASGRVEGSASRELSGDLIAALEERDGGIQLVRRDLADGLPFVDAAWIDANFTPEETRTSSHRDSLAQSDALVDELERADVIVIGTPMYNFNIPASLKAWIDLIARARLTFRYTKDGPVGLLTNKKAYLVIATGGVRIGSAADFATPYLAHMLGFIGINDVEIIAADGLNSRREESMQAARARIAELIQTGPQAG